MTEDHGEPIPGPTPVGPEYVFEPDPDIPMSPSLYVARKFMNLVKTPAHWIRENVILPNKGPKYYWYHRKFERALPIDECYLDDMACLAEANIEFKRLQLIDRETLRILKMRVDSCNFWNSTKHGRKFPSSKCQDLQDTYDKEEINFFIKYGDMRCNESVLFFYNKQKHRLIMERRRTLRAQQDDLPEGQSS